MEAICRELAKLYPPFPASFLFLASKLNLQLGREEAFVCCVAVLHCFALACLEHFELEQTLLSSNISNLDRAIVPAWNHRFSIDLRDNNGSIALRSSRTTPCCHFLQYICLAQDGSTTQPLPKDFAIPRLS
jgi:hypothetical protein